MLTRHCAPIIFKILFYRFFFPVRTATPFGAGCIGAPIVLAEYKEDDRVRCASPIFKPSAYKLSFTNRKRKYFEEQTMATLKIKQTSIAMVRNNILSAACFLTPLFFHYPLPLRNKYNLISVLRKKLNSPPQEKSLAKFR
jgi:hypothetical protein